MKDCLALPLKYNKMKYYLALPLISDFFWRKKYVKFKIDKFLRHNKCIEYF